MSLMMTVSQMTREGHHGQVGGRAPATLAVNRGLFLGAPRPVEGHRRQWPSWPSIISYPVYCKIVQPLRPWPQSEPSVPYSTCVCDVFPPCFSCILRAVLHRSPPGCTSGHVRAVKARWRHTAEYSLTPLPVHSHPQR